MVNSSLKRAEFRRYQLLTQRYSEMSLSGVGSGSRGAGIIRDYAGLRGLCGGGKTDDNRTSSHFVL